MRISDWSSDVCSSDLRPYTAFGYRPDDVILLGRESAGVQVEVHRAADARLVIPLRPGCRSLNVAQAGAMALGEALRQTGDRKSVVEGKSVSVSVDSGGRRII